jgi:hypothetical protein
MAVMGAAQVGPEMALTQLAMALVVVAVGVSLLLAQRLLVQAEMGHQALFTFIIKKD